MGRVELLGTLLTLVFSEVSTRNWILIYSNVGCRF